MTKPKELPPLFYFMELGEWEKAYDRLKRKPQELKVWASLRTRSVNDHTKRLALHHACFKLRSAAAAPYSDNKDSFVDVCKFILHVVKLYPEAASQRESRHGCLPLHLAAFASCAPRNEDTTPNPKIRKPAMIARRVASDATSATTETNLSDLMAEEMYAGEMNTRHNRDPGVSVSMRRDIIISPKREEYAVQVINALLDAYPKGVRVDSEGGRLPLHTACAGRATPRVISTLVTAYSSAARHRNKDGFLPLHLCAHWGISHPNVPVILLKVYPDATVGRNRWERTPLEEALCMAGENGRPHQSTLIRSLRKHPTYWTRPSNELLEVPSTAVDIDESLPSTDTSTLGDDAPNVNGSGVITNLIANLSTTLSHDEPTVPVESLVVQLKWRSLRSRMDSNPVEAEKELRVMTRGGFMSNTGFHALHYACERQPPVDAVRRLVTAFPLAVLSRAMPGGTLPLHIACTWYGSNDVVRCLVSADPGTVKITDELGNLPLHAACFSGASAEIVQALINADLLTVLTRNYQGSRPVDICKRLRHDNRRQVLQILIIAKDSITKHHRRRRSSGSLSGVATEAYELNRVGGSPERPIEVRHETMVEEPEEDGQQELVWI